MRGTLVLSVGNKALVAFSNACFIVFLCRSSGCCPNGLSLVSRVLTRVTGRVPCMSQMCDICGIRTRLFGGL